MHATMLQESVASMTTFSVNKETYGLKQLYYLHNLAGADKSCCVFTQIESMGFMTSTIYVKDSNNFLRFCNSSWSD